MKTSLKDLTFLVMLLSSILASCTKPATLEDQLIQKRKEDSAYNSSIEPGMGNLYFVEKLVAGKKAQHVMTFTMNQDTLAAFAKIDSSAKAKHIHTVMLTKFGEQKRLVNEIYPDEFKSRLYLIDKYNNRSPIVVEVQHLSATSQVVSILQVDWKKGTSKVLASSFLRNGQTEASFSSTITAAVTANKAWNCDEPQPAENMSDAVDNLLRYFMCGGHACDSFTACEKIKNALIGLYNKISSLLSSSEDEEDVSKIRQWSDELSAILNRINNKLRSFKSEKIKPDPNYEYYDNLLQEIDANRDRFECKALGPAFSNLIYDELNGGELKLVVEVTNLKTKLPQTSYPVFVEVEWIDPTTNTLLLRQSNPTVSGGMAIFRTDPSKLPNYKKYNRIKIQYGLVEDGGANVKTTEATLNFIKPKLVLLNNDPIPSYFQVKNQQDVYIKMVNEDGRALSLNHNKISIGNVTNSKVSLLASNSINYSRLIFNSLDGKTQDAMAEILYDSKKLQMLNFRIYIEPDSTDYYKNAVVGNWTVRMLSADQPYNTTMVIEPGGSGYYLSQGYPGGKGYISWRIVKLGEGEGYKFYEEGHWHFAFNGSPRTRLTPALSFTTYSNFDANKPVHQYTKQ